MLASVAAAGALVVSSAAPASADAYTSWTYLRNAATLDCLATDWSTRVYTFTGCNGPQRWQLQFLDAYPGSFLLRNEATGRCLKQVTISRVISASCDGSIIEFRWQSTSEFIWSANTGGLLVTDFTRKVSLYNADYWPSDQSWSLPYFLSATSGNLPQNESLVS